uniref:Reverse transcriptase zinc-binding domain-containing protein n=1 Tax=Photinus pyralis TaxID=7054 RepID=A0A1Y1L6Q7_PHOPY
MHFCRLRRPHYDPVMLFDRELRWTKHLENLLTSSRKSLNVLRVLSHLKWGAHPKSLLDVYKALILSRIDYGCYSYSSCNSTLLSKLDKIQNLAIRYSLGAFPTSPVCALNVEANILPLALRRKQLIVNYYLKVHQNDKHPNYRLLTDTTRPTRLYKSQGERARQFMEELQLQEDNIVDFTKVAVKHCVNERWQEQWARADTSLRRIKPNLGPLFLLDVERLHSTKLYRLRLGHTALTHSYLLKGEAPSLCNRCGINLTPEHILCVCVRYQNERDLFKISVIWETNFASQDRCRGVLGFMRSIGILNDL